MSDLYNFYAFCFPSRKKTTTTTTDAITPKKKKKLREIKSKQINRTRTDNTNNEINNRFK